ncbi:uncharacterized protein LOC126570677 [Anopheles aquasalis]|uniref:uncharacterized protein LOC126570677 n=1 Tax=Anopheles aquasalis TaxID=42839 RepID=UPI00215AE2E2|nr:uncharacterized protein LOC126570677 [Anopheles aquasalis]
MNSARIYGMRDSNGIAPTSQQRSPGNGGSTIPTPPDDQLTYESATSEYYLALSYNGYDFFRSVVEISLTISFLAANSNLLRLLVSFKETESFIASEVLVTLSIVMQILVGIAIVTITQVNDPSRYMKMKAFVIAGAIIIAVVNLMIPFIINVEHSRIDLDEIYRSYAQT